MIRKHSKIAVVGAGLVGATISYALAMKNLVSELVIIDINHDKAEGEAMDIREGLSVLGEMDVHCGEYSDVADSDIIIICAGVGRKPGETRIDLAKKNIGILEDVTRSIMKYYNGGVIMVVSNPVDILTYVVQKVSGLPDGLVFGTGAALDSARFRYLLSEKAEVDVKNVHGFIAGEHGDTQFPVWSSVHICGMEFDLYCKEHGLQVDKDEIETSVRNSGAEVIKRKGATYYAIASVVVSLCQAVVKNQKTLYHTTRMIHGLYGIDGVCLSLPNIIGIGGAERVIKFNFTEEEQEKLQKSAQHLKSVLKELEI